MIFKFKKKLSDPIFKEKLFLFIFPIKNFRILVAQNFNYLNKNKNSKKIFLKVFMQQLIYGIPFLIYDAYFYFFLRKQIEKSRQVILTKNNVKKIGIYSGWFDKFSGGSEKVASYFALFFETKFPNAEVEFILNDLFAHKSDVQVNLDDIEKKFGIKLHKTKIRVFYHDSKHLFKTKFLSNFVKTTNDYDILINCLMNIYPTLGKLNYHYIHFPMDKSFAISNLVFRNYAKSYKMFITNSEYTDYWARQILKVANTKVIYPCIDIPDINAEFQKKKIILTVSRFSNEKKIEVLIEVFQEFFDKLQGYEFHIAGISNPNQFDYYQQLVSNTYNPNIFFFPNIPLENLIQKYKDSKIYWNSMGFGLDKNENPFYFEHFGLTVAEALSYGVVPIVIGIGGPAEIIQKGNCGLTWWTKEDLLNQTLMLINDDELYDTYQKNAIEYSKNFSINEFFTQLEDVLKNALK